MANPGHSGDVEWVCVVDPTFAPDPSMPDRLPRTPFDAVTDPEPPEATPNRPPHAPPGAEEYALQIKETADKLLKDHASRGDVKLIATPIRLPFEQPASSVVQGDPKLGTLRYFFTRKLMFIKESDAVVLFPGGFGTHDEAYEALTLIQTGKSHLFPIVMVDEPGGDYWTLWQRFMEEALLARGYISPHDMSLFRVTDSVEAAVKEVTGFYRVYHSMRYVRGDLVLRLRARLTDRLLDHI